MTPAPRAPVASAASSAFADRVAAVAVAAAERAGQIQRRHFRDPAVRVTRLLHDVKLDTDRLCEEVIVTAIRETFPDHAIVAEESGLLAGDGACTWIVDPLDGTVNFWHGLPFFGVSIACYRNTAAASGQGLAEGGPAGEPVAGVVFLPFSRELFVGIQGRGAFLNWCPIRVSAADRPCDMVVTVSFGKTPETMRRMTRRLDVLLPQVRKVRCLGAAAAEMAYAAAGFLGGVFYEGLRWWDFAAARIILEQAGGFFEAMETGPDRWRVLAGAPGIRESLSSLVAH